MLDDTILTIEEVAQYLRVSERTVYEWAQKGEIPAGKIGTVWRFKASEIERWVDDRLSTGSRGLAPPVDLRAVLSPDRIVFPRTASKRDVLVELAANLALAPQVRNAQELAQEIIKREELMSTAIGRGIAIPHVRLQSVTDIVVSVGISGVGVEGFNPLDDEPVRLIFMIAAAYNQHAEYLRTLSFFSSRLRDPELRAALLRCGSADDAFALLTGEPAGEDAR